MKTGPLATLIAAPILLAFVSCAKDSTPGEMAAPSKEVHQPPSERRDLAPAPEEVKALQEELARTKEELARTNAELAAQQAAPAAPAPSPPGMPRFEICRNCNGTGFVTETEKCRECGGAGEIKCTYCNGTGKIFDGKTCITCNGAGKKTCPGVDAPFGPGYCIGTGVADRRCRACNGKGKIDLSKN